MHHEKACQATAAAKARAAKKAAAKEVKAEVKEEKKEVVKEKKEVSPELKEKRLEALVKARAVRASRKAESSAGEERTIASEIKKKVSK
jgi:hypothetical protein